MSKIAALKKKATEYEQKKQFDKALTAYQQVLEANESSGEELDVALYNRVGDLLLRTGNVGDAVTYYEKAVDLYAEGGFFNNAIALCNKILRQSPGRTSIYYKLGKISAQKGFKSDAKQNFLEYADRMQKSGETEEAFRALKEFADLSPDQDDIRLMLADQLSKLGKKDEAMEQFQSLLDKYDSEGRKQEANATIERMKAIDPEVDPRPSGQQKQRKSTDLVFLDLTDEPRQSGAVPTIDGPPPAQPETTPEPETSGGSVEGLEVTSFGEGASADAAEYGVNVEPIDLDSPSEPVELELETSEPAEDLDLVSPDESSGDLPLLDTEETSSSQELTFITPDDGDDANSLSSLLTSDEPETPEPGLVDLGSPDETIELDAPAAELDVPAEIAGSETSAEVVGTTDMAEELGGQRQQRKSTSILARSVDGLRVSVEIRPDDWGLRRSFGEALLEDGERDAGLAELDAAMVGFEKAGDLDSAKSVAEEIVKVNPDSIRHLQKRVEYAFRSSDRPRLAQCYVELGDAMLRTGQTEKARSVYQRVLELNPDDIRAQAALSSLGEAAPPEPEPAPAPRQSVAAPRRSTTGIDAAAKPAAEPEAAGGDDEFVDLGAWLREDEGPKDTRMVVAEEEPTGDEEADFQDMLKKFKQGVSENVEEEDYHSHYDLGVAYKEMGLVDEAIAQFQKALRGPDLKVRCYEALGQCFLDKSQPQIASTILTRALNERGMDDAQLIGVLYLLGTATEELKKTEEALSYYNRVFAVDITFRDVGERINALEKVGQ